jgi:hypothetical protein
VYWAPASVWKLKEKELPVSPKNMPYVAIARSSTFFHSGTGSASISAGDIASCRREPIGGALAMSLEQRLSDAFAG